MKLPITVERRKQSVNGALICAERKLAALEIPQFLHAFADLFAEVQHFVRVFDKQRARIGERSRPRATNEKGLADPFLEFADRYAYGRLGAIELLRRPGKTTLARHGLKYLKRRKIHEIPR